MALFQKPNVDIEFSKFEPGEDDVYRPKREEWANTAGRRWLLTFVLVVLTVSAFVFPTIKGSALPGDDAAVLKNSQFFDQHGMLVIWGSPQRLALFSPISNSFYLIEHQFFVAQPRGYRIVSIFLHVGNALLLWLLLRRLELPGAWLGAALFAVHPIQVDAVSWLSQQRYLVCGLFYLSALLVYLRRCGLNPAPEPPPPGSEPLIYIGLPESRRWLYVITSVLYLVAILSHIVGVTFPLVVLILIWWERGRIRPRDWKPLLPFGVVSVLYAGFSAWLYYYRTHSLWFEYPGGVNFIVIWGRAAWTYLSAILVPINLAFAYPRWSPESIRPWQWLYPLTAVGALAMLWLMRRRWGRGPLTSVLLLLALLLPAAFGAADPNDGELPGVMVREHVLYLACIGIIAGAVAGIAEYLGEAGWGKRLLRTPGVAPLLALAVVTPMAVASSIHSRSYTTPIKLWQNVLDSQGASPVALNSLGTLEVAANDFTSAEQHFRDALLLSPGDDQSTLNLANLAARQKQYDVAIERYDEVLARHPTSQDARFGLAAALSAQGDTKDALREYAILEQQNPQNAQLFNNRGLIYAQLGDADGAIAQYRKSIALDGTFEPAYINLANALFQQKKFTEARDAITKVLDLDPQSYVAWLNAGVMAAAVGDATSAERYFRIAIYCKYDCAEAFNYLGVLFMQMGDPPGKTEHVGEAVYCFKRAAELDPSKPEYAQAEDAARKREDAIIASQ
jgi:tetratricopeptide (TPR) repeat protein